MYKDVLFIFSPFEFLDVIAPLACRVVGFVPWLGWGNSFIHTKAIYLLFRIASYRFLNARPTGGRVYLLFRYVSILFICKSAATPLVPAPASEKAYRHRPHRLLTQSYYLVSQPTLCVFVNIRCSLFLLLPPPTHLILSHSCSHYLHLRRNIIQHPHDFPSFFSYFSSRFYFHCPFLYYYYFTPTKYILIIIKFLKSCHVFKGIRQYVIVPFLYIRLLKFV